MSTKTRCFPPADLYLWSSMQGSLLSCRARSAMRLAVYHSTPAIRRQNETRPPEFSHRIGRTLVHRGKWRNAPVRIGRELQLAGREPEGLSSIDARLRCNARRESRPKTTFPQNLSVLPTTPYIPATPLQRISHPQDGNAGFAVTRIAGRGL